MQPGGVLGDHEQNTHFCESAEKHACLVIGNAQHASCALNAARLLKTSGSRHASPVQPMADVWHVIDGVRTKGPRLPQNAQLMFNTVATRQVHLQLDAEGRCRLPFPVRSDCSAAREHAAVAVHCSRAYQAFSVFGVLE